MKGGGVDGIVARTKGTYPDKRNIYYVTDNQVMMAVVRLSKSYFSLTTRNDWFGSVSVINLRDIYIAI
jgi:hypothetical protein